MDLLTLKTNLIKNVKKYYEIDIIYATFPLHKQMNINAGIRSTSREKMDMNSFIVEKLNDIDSIESGIDGLKDTKIWDNFNRKNSENKNIKYISSYIHTVSKQEQKIIILKSLKDIVDVKSINSYN